MTKDTLQNVIPILKKDSLCNTGATGGSPSTGLALSSVEIAKPHMKNFRTSWNKQLSLGNFTNMNSSSTSILQSTFQSTNQKWNSKKLAKNTGGYKLVGDVIP